MWKWEHFINECVLKCMQLILTLHVLRHYILYSPYGLNVGVICVSYGLLIIGCADMLTIKNLFTKCNVITKDRIYMLQKKIDS